MTAGPEVLLETERLILRWFTPADVDLLVELDSDPAVMHFITGGRATSREEVEHDVLPAFLRYRERGTDGFWAAEDRAGTFLGRFHLRPAPGRLDHEVGYRLRRAAWGRGFAAEGSAALIDRAFGAPGAQRVVAETMAVHTASRRVLEKVGMTHVRTFHTDWLYRIEGDEHGDVEYALTRADWAARR